MPRGIFIVPEREIPPRPSAIKPGIHADANGETATTNTKIIIHTEAWPLIRPTLVSNNYIPDSLRRRNTPTTAGDEGMAPSS